MAYGTELIIDLYHCDVSKFNRTDLVIFLQNLCDLAKMEREDLYWWDYDDKEEYDVAPDHLAGISLVQFISTSSVTIHTLDRVGECMINFFTCKKFNVDVIVGFIVEWFKAERFEKQVIVRGRYTECQI